MDPLTTLDFAVRELRGQVVALHDAEMAIVSNCEPWTVRELASHALNNQLLWGSVVTGEETVSFEETMAGVAYDGNLAQYADTVTTRSLAMWNTAGVLDASHVTPFGELPGSVVINFPTIDALCHAWDVAASVGRPIQFPPEWLPTISSLVDATCTDAVRDIGLIKAARSTADDASETERLMAQAGRSLPR